MEWKITKDEWLLLPEHEKKYFEYESDESGCYFVRRIKESNAKNAVDDFERLVKNSGGKKNG